MKTCSSCSVEKPFAMFYKHRRSSDGLQSYCKVCHTERNKKWASNNKEAQALTYKRHSLKKQYGLTLQQFKSLLEEQGHECKICSTKLDINIKNGVNVDHNHNTGAVRGLLCNPCNTALGGFRDSVEILNNAINYLNQFGSYGGDDGAYSAAT